VKEFNTINVSRHLRQAQTEAERRVWFELRDRRFMGLKFRRQHPVAGFVTDFSCFEAKIIVELDGGQHNLEPAKEQDNQRTKILQSQGYRVIRFGNNDILSNMNGCLEELRAVVATSSPQPSPPKEERELKG